MSNLKKNAKSNKNATSIGLSLQGSQINLSTRLSNVNISNPLNYLYNENVDTPSRGRPMSASTLGTTYQESPRRSTLIKRPQSADTINKIIKNRHIAFNFNDQQNNTSVANCADQESAFDEPDAGELSSSSRSPEPSSSSGGSGRSTPALHRQPTATERPRGNDAQPALEPGLVSKPPLPPPAGNNGPPATRETTDPEPRPPPKGSVTFDDAIELKFQRWFPNSAAAPVASGALPTAVASAVSGTAATAASVAEASLSSSSSPPPLLDSVSYEYCSERVIDTDRGTVTYTRSSSSMSVRGCGQDQQLDEEHLFSNLSAAIGGAGDRLKTSSVSVDLSNALRRDDDDRGRVSRATAAVAKSKRKTKRDAPVQHQQQSKQNGRTRRDVETPKSATKMQKATGGGNESSRRVTPSSRNDQASDGRETKRDHHHHHQLKKTDDSPVDEVREDVVSWMSSHHPTPSQTPEIDVASLDAFRKQNHHNKTTTYDEIVNILKELESENNDIGS